MALFAMKNFLCEYHLSVAIIFSFDHHNSAIKINIHIYTRLLRISIFDAKRFVHTHHARLVPGKDIR